MNFSKPVLSLRSLSNINITSSLLTSACDNGSEGILRIKLNTAVTLQSLCFMLFVGKQSLVNIAAIKFILYCIFNLQWGKYIHLKWRFFSCHSKEWNLWSNCIRIRREELSHNGDVCMLFLIQLPFSVYCVLKLKNPTSQMEVCHSTRSRWS